MCRGVDRYLCFECAVRLGVPSVRGSFNTKNDLTSTESKRFFAARYVLDLGQNMSYMSSVRHTLL